MPITLDSGVTTIGGTGDGHMRTSVTIDGAGALHATTTTWDTNGWGFLTGFHGAAAIAVFDENKNLLDAFGSPPYGVEGGQSRTDAWNAVFTSVGLNMVSSVAVTKCYDPQYNAVPNIIKWAASNYQLLSSIAQIVASKK